MRFWFAIVLAGCLVWQIPSISYGQTSYAPEAEETHPENWRNYSDTERKELRKQYFLSLPKKIWENLRTQVKRFYNMKPAKRRIMCDRFHQDRGYLPPACVELNDF